MSPKSAEERDGESEENEAEESEESINYSEDSNPNYFPGNVKTICWKNWKNSKFKNLLFKNHKALIRVWAKDIGENFYLFHQVTLKPTRVKPCLQQAAIRYHK